MTRKKWIPFLPLGILFALFVGFSLRYAFNFMQPVRLSVDEEVERLAVSSPSGQKISVTDPDAVAGFVALVNDTAFRKDLRPHNDSPGYSYGLVKVLSEDGSSVCDIEFTVDYNDQIRFCIFQDRSAFVAYHEKEIASRIAGFLTEAQAA